MKQRGYCFAGLTLDDFNPENIALKNDFNHSLHLMMITMAPMFANCFTGLKVSKGMCSHKLSIREGKDNFIDKKFSSGEACTVTSEAMNRKNTIDILNKFKDKLEESYSFIVGDNDLTVFKSDKREILEYVEGKLRTISS